MPGNPEVLSWLLDSDPSSVTWQGDPAHDGRRFFEGEVEPCINGQVGALGAYFGQDVRGIVERLLAEQLPDGGWNCAKEPRARRWWR